MSLAVSTFNDYTDAQRAVDRLVHAGFHRMDLHIEVDAASRPAPEQEDSPRHEQDRGVLASIGCAFVSLFGQDHPHHEVQAYGEAARHGHSVVMVYVENDEEARRATQVMNERGKAPAGRQPGLWRPGARRTPAGSHAPAE